MGYVDEISEFYDWLETNQLPKSVVSLWYALMHIAHKARWQETFAVAMSTIESKTGFRKSELEEARTLLQQKGRLIWKKRVGSASAEYQIHPFCVHIAGTTHRTKSAQTPAQMGAITAKHSIVMHGAELIYADTGVDRFHDLATDVDAKNDGRFSAWYGRDSQRCDDSNVPHIVFVF